jgi:hypothetical protein
MINVLYTTYLGIGVVAYLGDEGGGQLEQNQLLLLLFIRG